MDTGVSRRGQQDAAVPIVKAGEDLPVEIDDRLKAGLVAIFPVEGQTHRLTAPPDGYLKGGREPVGAAALLRHAPTEVGQQRLRGRAGWAAPELAGPDRCPYSGIRRRGWGHGADRNRARGDTEQDMVDQTAIAYGGSGDLRDAGGEFFEGE